ncbi:hypothetical protein [Rhodococcus sp. AG1013]|nr:hypothetical protein [Rhodococcus sp. AG1013]
MSGAPARKSGSNGGRPSITADPPAHPGDVNMQHAQRSEHERR